jgi:hypothetical protein
VFRRLLFVIWFFFFWLLYCLSLYDLQLVIVTLVSSKLFLIMNVPDKKLFQKKVVRITLFSINDIDEVVLYAINVFFCVVFLFCLSSSCVLCTQCCQPVSLDCPFLISLCSKVYLEEKQQIPNSVLKYLRDLEVKDTTDTHMSAYNFCKLGGWRSIA